MIRNFNVIFANVVLNKDVKDNIPAKVCVEKSGLALITYTTDR